MCNRFMFAKSVLSISLVLTLLLASCSRKSVLSIDCADVDYSNKTGVELKGNLLVPELMGAMDIACIDSLVIVTTEQSDAQLMVFNNRLETLGKFCQKGRSKNEFLDVSNNVFQVWRRNGHIICPLADDYVMVKEVDITESLLQGKTVVADAASMDPMYEVMTLFLDENINNRFKFTLCKYGPFEEVTGVPCVYEVEYPDQETKELELFRKPVDVDDEKLMVAPYSSEIYKHPSRNIVVSANNDLEYVIFFNLEENRTFAVHKKGAPTFDDHYEYNEEFAFMGGCSTSDYIMLLYYRGDENMKEPDRKKRKSEVVIFDWDGNFIDNIRVDKRLSSIGYDESTGTLFALTFSEELYSYDLSDYLK